MKRHRHTPEQAVRKLREGERLLSEGTDLTVDSARRLEELESENARLKKLLAEAELDKAMLKELAEGRW